MTASRSVAALMLLAVFAMAGNCFPDPPASAPVVGVQAVLNSKARPAETPGSPGVMVVNEKLITQFGGSHFSLNKARYTRWHTEGSYGQPDAILIVVAGFGGGANNYKIMAEDLIPRMRADHAINLEVWGFHRRTNQLEDRAGVVIAEGSNDPLIALDWYYGGDMGLPLHPELVAGPNRRALFYNTSDDLPFLANWTSHVFSQDLDAVVRVARFWARNGNAFLAGHSAGTGFVARYAATDFKPGNGGPARPGYENLKGLVLIEGGGGSTGNPLSEDSLNRIEARFDGGLYHAVRDAAPRCVNGDPCAMATEAVDCAAAAVPWCTPNTSAYSAVGGLSPRVTAASEVLAIQGRTDPDGGQVILQVDQGAPGNNAIAKVPDLAILSLFVPPSTVDATFGIFLDDDGLAASFLSPALATSVGGPGPVVGGLSTWQAISEGPLPPEPDNGPAPTTLPASRWGQEKEVVEISRLRETFLAAGANAADWYYATSGLSVTSVPGVCDIATCSPSFVCTGGSRTGLGCFVDAQCGASLCTVGAVGQACSSHNACSQSISLDSTALSVDRGRRDIVNLTEAAGIDIPVICFGGTNGLTPVPGNYLSFASSIGPCTADSCDGATPRIVDPMIPNAAFPTFGDVVGGFEVHMSEGFAHNDMMTAEDDAENNVIGPLSDFIERNSDLTGPPF